MSNKSCLYLFVLYPACSKLLAEPRVNSLIPAHLLYSRFGFDCAAGIAENLNWKYLYECRLLDFTQVF